MKKINYFFEKAPVWQVYIIGSIIATLVFFSMFKFLELRIPTAESTVIANNFILMKISATIGFIFGLLIMLMTYSARNSQKFWEYSEIVEVKIKDAKTRKELKEIETNDFKELKRKASGSPHYNECNKLHTIMETKWEFVN